MAQFSVPAKMTLAELHAVLQIAFGWQNSHLHDFEIEGIRFGMADVDDELFRRLLGARRGRRERGRERYARDRLWRRRTGLARPRTAAALTATQNLIRVLATPDDDEYASSRQWVGRRFDPERFDRAAVNKRLAAFF